MFAISLFSPLGEGRGIRIFFGILCAKLGWNWLSGSGEDNVYFVHVFSLFCNYLPFKTVGALHLNILEFPSSKEALCQVLLKLDQWFWRTRWKCEKFTTTPTTSPTTITTTDNAQIRKAHLSLLLRWAKHELSIFLILCVYSFITSTFFLSNGSPHHTNQFKK